MNECVVVGRVKELPEVRKTAKGTTLTNLIVESDRNFRDEDGKFSTDVFSVTVWRGAAETAASLCKPGSMIAIKGRLTGKLIQKEDREYYSTEIIAESIDYLRGLTAA